MWDLWDVCGSTWINKLINEYLHMSSLIKFNSKVLEEKYSANAVRIKIRLE